MSWFIALFIGLNLLALSLFLALRQHLWLRNARIVDGTVVELIASRDRKDEKISYTPRVEFKAADGSRHEFTRDYSTRPAGFTVGERLKVAYDFRTYSARILTFSQRFGMPVIVGSIGVGLTLMALCFIFGKNVVPGIYLKQAPPNDSRI